MFKNIGKKIKVLAEVFCLLILLFGVVATISGAISKNYEALWIGVLYIILAPISVWVLYGFGELIEKVTQIEINTRKEEKKEEDK